MCLRQAHDLLHKKRIHLRRVNNCVTKEIIHRREARRVEVADSRDLYGRGLICRNLQCLPACRMPGKIKENIHLIGIDMLSRFLGAEFREVDIAIRHPCDPVCHLTLQISYVVEINLETISIIGSKELYRKVQYNMIRKIRREITYTQLLPSSLRVCERLRYAEQRGICQMRRAQLLIRNTIDVVKIHQIVAHRGKAHRPIGARQFPRHLQMRQCRLQIREAEENLPHKLMQLPVPL